MKSLCYLLLIVFALTSSVVAVEKVQKIVQVDLKEQSETIQRAFFELGLDVTSVDRNERNVTILATEKEIEQLGQIGLTHTVLLPDANEFARQLRASGYLDHFRDYDTIVQQMESWVSQYPDIAKLEDIGDSYEKINNRGGHDIWAIKISDNVQVEEDEPEVFIMANLHAREIITPEIVMYFMEYVFTHYGSDPYVTYLVDNRQIWIVPSANPDGLEYVMTGENPTDRTYTDPFWWRKNKQDNNNNGRFDPEYDGVDLNRNFGYEWGRDNIGSSGNPGSATYRGTGPFSEPESQVIRDFTMAHNFIISISFHSYSQLWLYPWGFTRDLSPDHETFVALADCCVAYNGYIPETAAELYLVNGDTDDWFYGEQTTKNKIFAFTPEVGNRAESLGGWTGFFPDTLYIEKQILENQGPIFYLLYAAGEEPIVEPMLFPDTENATGPYETLVTVRQPLVLTEAAAIDVSTVKIYYNTTGKDNPFNSTILSPTPDAEIFLASIPTQGDQTTIYYYFAATDLMGRTGHAPRMAPLAVYSFSVGPDTIAPEIKHTPLADQNSSMTAFTIQAKIQDNAGIEQALVAFSKNSGPVDTLEMKPIEGSEKYQAIIEPVTVAPGDFFDYQIIATDLSQRKNTTTAPTSGFYRFRILPGILFDFEDDNGGFSTNSNSDWEWGVPTSGPRNARSGAKVWATNLNGNYSNNSNSKLDTPPINLTGYSKAYLTFWHWYENETSSSLWDGGNVKISVNNGPFEIITPVDGYDGILDQYNTIIGGELVFGGAAGNGNFWHKELFDLTPFLDKEIKIRFHFGSDNNTTMAGWYLDDVEFLLLPAAPPMISGVSVLPHTTDNVGPYSVLARITDDDGINSATLWYSADNKVTFIPVIMETVGENLFRGNIPGQPYTTTVRYYVQALDNALDESFEPAQAPEITYQFWVTDRVPTIEIRPENVDISLRQDSLYVDSLLIVNQGILDLEFQIRDSLFSLSNSAQNILDGNFSLKWAEIYPSIQQLISTNSGRMKGLQTVKAENQFQEAFLVQQINDPQESGASSDMLALRAQLSPTTLSLNVDFAREMNRSSDFVIVSLNTDQKTTTGSFSTSVAGADYHLVWDLGNLFGLSAPSAILLNDDFTQYLGTVPVTLTPKSAAIKIPRVALAEYDGNLDLAAISFSNDATAFDRLPDNQNIIFGSEASLPWLSVEPQGARIGGEDSIFVYLKINTQALTPGNYDAALFFQSNDPNRPEVSVPVRINIQDPAGVAVTQHQPGEFRLLPNFPNPFNPETTIKFQLAATTRVGLKIYNVNGQLVRTLVQETREAGTHEVIWNGQNELGKPVSSGVYLLKFSAGAFQQTRKMLLLQ